MCNPWKRTFILVALAPFNHVFTQLNLHTHIIHDEKLGKNSNDNLPSKGC
jgi:hypothetical protein